MEEILNGSKDEALYLYILVNVNSFAIYRGITPTL